MGTILSFLMVLFGFIILSILKKMKTNLKFLKNLGLYQLINFLKMFYTTKNLDTILLEFPLERKVILLHRQKFRPYFQK